MLHSRVETRPKQESISLCKSIGEKTEILALKSGEIYTLEK